MLFFSTMMEGSNPGPNEISWHILYFDTSYMMYIGFTTVVILYFAIVYCIKVPTHHFPELKEILDNDPVINAHVLREPVNRDEWYMNTQTTQSTWIDDKIREKKGETLNTEKQEPASTDLRNRKSKSIKFKSGKDYIPSREGSIKSHHTPKSYKSHGSLASPNQEETVAFIGSSSIMKRKRIVIDDNTYTISDPSIMESLGALGSGSPTINVKQSSTLLDVADNILLQGDGDLLTIHQEPNDVAGNEVYACKEPLQDNNDTNDTMSAELKTSREDVLTSVLSSSPSMQTVISRQEMLVPDPLQKDDTDVDDKQINVDSLENEWI